MENEDDDDGIEEEDEEEDDEMRSLQLPDDMNVQKKVSIPSLLKNKVNGKAALQSQPRRSIVADQPNSDIVRKPQPTTQVKRTLPIPKMADHYPDPDDVKAVRESCGKPLRGQHHGVLPPQPRHIIVAEQPSGLTELVRNPIVRTPRSQTSFQVSERDRDWRMAQEYATHKKRQLAEDRDNFTTSLRAMEAQKPPSPPRDPRQPPEKLRAAMAAAAARWAAGAVAPVAPTETKQKRSRWGPRHVPDPNTTPSPKRSRWGPRHSTATALQQVHQNDQQRNQSFALALADLERAQAYQREQLYSAFGM